MAECGFRQIVGSPTCGENILDLLFTNRPSLVHSCHVTPGISDHEIILASIKSKITYQNSNSYKIFLWNLSNLSEMKHKMSEFTTQFCRKYNHDSPVELLWSSLHDKVLQCLDIIVPLKMKHSCPTIPWVTHNLKQLWRLKQTCCNCAKLSQLTSALGNQEFETNNAKGV